LPVSWGCPAVAASVLGDVADTLFKAHVRNQRIIDDYMASEQYAV